MTDEEIILALGGPTKVAEMLGLDKTKGGVQRVQNWKKRGIPAQVKLEHPDLFLTELLSAPCSSSKKVKPIKYGRRSTDRKPQQQ